MLLALFLPLIAGQRAKIRMVVKSPLSRLFDGMKGVERTGHCAAEDDQIDMWMSLMDIPKLVYGLDEAGKAPPPVSLNIPEDSVKRPRQWRRGPDKLYFKRY